MLPPPLLSALGRLRQEDCEFEAGLGYIARLPPKYFSDFQFLEEVTMAANVVLWLEKSCLCCLTQNFTSQPDQIPLLLTPVLV